VCTVPDPTARGASDVLRFGLIGAGQQGRHLARALRAVPGARLVACSDPDPLAVHAVRGAHLARCTDFRALLDLPHLDAVIVATPHHVLPVAARAAAESGRHVFCEKPLAPSASLARPIVAAADHANVRLMVGYLLRFDPYRRRLKCLLDARALGDLAYVVAGKGGPPLTAWRTLRASGGGQLLWVGSHLLDQVLWLVGRPVERVYAEIRRVVDAAGDGVDITSVVTLRFAGGLLAHLDCSQAAVEPYDFVEVAGVDGRARADWRPRHQLTVQSQRVPGNATPRTERSRPSMLRRESVAELAEFVQSIVEARPPAITGQDALRVLEVLDAIALSAERGQPVQVSSAA